MRDFRWIASASLLGASLLALSIGCSSDNDATDAGPPPVDAEPPPPDARTVPIFRNPVDTPDPELAHDALVLLGAAQLGGTENCNDCHGLTGTRMRDWGVMAKESLSTCLTNLDVTDAAEAKTMLDCLRGDPTDPTSPFVTAKLGPLASAATLDWFKYAFELAYGPTWQTTYEEFRSRVAMPQGMHPSYTQAEFDVVAEWFLRGAPMVDDLIPDEPPTAGCEESITPDLVAHVDAMETTGWAAVDKEQGMLMFGCAGTADPRDCLGTFPLAKDSTISKTWDLLPGSRMRLLHTSTFSSAYWTRASADGRFVGAGAYGNGFDAAIVDLQSGQTIKLDAMYDPGFFPDGKAWMFQGEQDAFVCDSSVLTAGPTTITFEEPGCTTLSQNDIGLYQSVGTAVGGDYWAVASEFNSDNGAQNNPTFSEPKADFRSDARIHLAPMIHTGSSFEPAPGIDLPVPYEGDFVMSPSSRLVVSRLAGPNNKQKAFVVHRLDAEKDGAGGYTATLPEVGRFCMRGAKPSFSYDERWMIMHHYVDGQSAVELGFDGPDDPGFAPYKQQGAANVFLVDLTTGARTRITNMAPGQYALYPHFRADGWIYFIVRFPGQSKEYTVASDAALLLAQ